MQWRLVPLTVFCLFIAAGAAYSTSVIPPTFDQLVTEAQTVFVGQVVGQRAVLDRTSQGEVIHTIVTFRVEDVWKGSVGTMTQLEFLGGTVGDLTLDVSEMPKFSIGSRSVLFVAPGSRLISPLVGFMYGRFRIEADPASGIDRVRTNDGRSLAALADIGAQKPPSFLSLTPMRLSDMAAAVRARVTAGRAR